VDFARFVRATADIGCNTITLDDLVHLYPWHQYDASVKAKIQVYGA
jgi:hypothetical protein